jgi:hypothetical protein
LVESEEGKEDMDIDENNSMGNPTIEIFKNNSDNFDNSKYRPLSCRNQGQIIIIGDESKDSNIKDAR